MISNSMQREIPAVEPLLPTLADAVVGALHKTGHTYLRRVDVTVNDGRVTLRGLVPSFYLKQLAQTIVMALTGVESVRNELVVGGR